MRQNKLWEFLMIKDVLSVAIPYLDIRSMFAFRAVFLLLPDKFLKQQTESSRLLLQKELAENYCFVTKQLFFAPQKSPYERAIQRHFVLAQKNMVEHIDESEIWSLLLSNHLDYYGTVKILLENAMRYFMQMPEELEMKIQACLRFVIYYDEFIDSNRKETALLLIPYLGDVAVENCWNETTYYAKQSSTTIQERAEVFLIHLALIAYSVRIDR